MRSDLDGFVLEAQHQNGIKKLVKNIHWKKINDSFFKTKIDKILTYKKQSYYGLKIVEAKWELDHYQNSLKKHQKMKEASQITTEQFQDIEQQFQPWFQEIEERIKKLKEKDRNAKLK